MERFQQAQSQEHQIQHERTNASSIGRSLSTDRGKGSRQILTAETNHGDVEGNRKTSTGTEWQTGTIP